MLRSALAVLVLCFAFAGSASAENFTFYSSPHRVAPWHGPACDSPDVIKRIAIKFDQAEKVYWHTGLRMAHVTHARETTFRDWQPPIIATRYCTATAYLTNGARYKMVYWLRSEQSFAGASWGVEFCLVGRDRDLSYAPYCRMLRPL